jgi:hypothetical protein
MRSEKIRALLNAVKAWLYAQTMALMEPFSTNMAIVHYRWQATREQYENRIVNSVSLPGLKARGRFTNVHEALGDIFDALLIIVFGSALIVTVANSTTGAAAKNGNVSASPGAVAIVQLLPFIFVAIIAFSAFDLLRSRRKM